MDRLPTEILAQITSHLKALLKKTSGSCPRNTRVASYSTINSAWQEVVERETFRHISINTDQIPELRAILSNSPAGQRIRSIRTLNVRVLYNHLLVTEQSQWDEQRRQRDESFSDSLRALFGLVKEWEGDVAGSVVAEGYQLRVGFSTGSRPNARSAAPQPRVGGLFGRSFSPWPLPGDADDARDEAESTVNRVEQADLRYVGAQELPEINLVSFVLLGETHGVHPETLIRILSRMKGLVELEGSIFGEYRNVDLIREYRQVLSRSLHLLPPTLKRFRLDFRPAGPEPRISHSVLVDPERDELCIGLRALSEQLRKLSLTDLRISSAIFAGDGDGAYPDWPDLEEVYIAYPPLSSSGQWFAHTPPPKEEAQDDPDDTDDTDGSFRNIPDARLLNELYAAAGEAKQHMPRLKSLELILDLDIGQHKFMYYFDQAQKRYTIALESSVSFDISDEVAEAWGFEMEAVNSFDEGGLSVLEVLL